MTKKTIYVIEWCGFPISGTYKTKAEAEAKMAEFNKNRVYGGYAIKEVKV